MNDQQKLSLPENAYRELRPGESYTPVIPAERGVLEVTLRSAAIGFGMAVLFSAAAAYIALKLGQGIESAIPISINGCGSRPMTKAGCARCSAPTTFARRFERCSRPRIFPVSAVEPTASRRAGRRATAVSTRTARPCEDASKPSPVSRRPAVLCRAWPPEGVSGRRAVFRRPQPEVPIRLKSTILLLY